MDRVIKYLCWFAKFCRNTVLFWDGNLFRQNVHSEERCWRRSSTKAIFKAKKESWLSQRMPFPLNFEKENSHEITFN